MQPLTSVTQDSDKLQDIGRASIQIVHDLKNQLNGLKLYATFLRKRLEKSERPSDEQETVAKLISGLERAAEDLSAIVHYGRPLQLKKQSSVDIHKLMRNVCATVNERRNGTGSLVGTLTIRAEEGNWLGEFDPTLLAEAFRYISLGALKVARPVPDSEPVVVTFSTAPESPSLAMIEWSGVNQDHDPFKSFAGSDEIRMSLAAKTIEAHGGTTEYEHGLIRVKLPLAV